MSLKPHPKDPNRRAELKRMKEEPWSFGIKSTVEEKPVDWKPNRLKGAATKSTISAENSKGAK